MTEFKIGCSPITAEIYAGNVRENKNGQQVWTSTRHEVTEMAVDCVVQRLNMLPNKTEKYAWELDGKTYVLKLVEYEPKKEDEPHEE